MLETALRDSLREDLGQTYTVSVGLSQSPPQRGDGYVEVSFGAAPENIQAMTDRVLEEVKRLQQEGPSAGSRDQGQGIGAARLRDRAEAERLLAAPAAVDPPARRRSVATSSRACSASTR